MQQNIFYKKNQTHYISFEFDSIFSLKKNLTKKKISQKAPLQSYSKQKKSRHELIPMCVIRLQI